MRFLIGAVLLGLTVLQALTAGASAQAYPTKPVSLLIAFPPGGPSDVLSRVVGKKLEQILGQPFIMDNRPGAGGNIAAEAAAHAAADGYTILMGNNSILATNAALYKKVNFDAERDFAPISLIGAQANILVVNPDMPVKSLA
jgi:tripartite-type tricarboxylate transporter receptor subunit TctC